MVEGYLGLPGAGKTFSAVHELTKRRRHNPNLRVYSNMTVNLPGDGEFIKLESWEQLLDAYDGVVLLDEINLWMPSRAWSKLPGPLLWKWAQVRKSGLDIIWTAQHQARVDKLVRELTWMLYKMFSWKKLGFFAGKAYLGEIKPELFASWVFIPFDIRVAGRYDTFEEVSLPEYLEGALRKDMAAVGGGKPTVGALLKELAKAQEMLREIEGAVAAGASLSGEDVGGLLEWKERVLSLSQQIALRAGAPGAA